MLESMVLNLVCLHCSLFLMLHLFHSQLLMHLLLQTLLALLQHQICLHQTQVLLPACLLISAPALDISASVNASLTPNLEPPNLLHEQHLPYYQFVYFACLFLIAQSVGSTLFEKHLEISLPSMIKTWTK